ncbi:efflux RND transporter permease subunit [Dethiobacter alkaliphilus]|uniref:efflux RND transporter permease subunit n=1 Tax=Dethiobacter alkaliphilus TaxID=427926 RepID=UPI00222641A3|nr:MMPL family transporter [Dethiobacter alkaliphilus]MCW3489457.1 MMPL family transporter [Dethiobacter alkaliphilus]
MRFNRIFKNTYKYMGPSVLIAMVATILGFTALFISPVPMIADFGKTLTLGLAVSFLAALIILTTNLYIRDKYFCDHTAAKACQLPPENKWLETMLAKLTKLVLSKKFLILTICLAITVWGFFGDTNVGVQTDIETFMPQDTPELVEIREFRDLMGSTDQLTIMVQGPDLLDDKNLEWVETLTTGVENQFPEIIDSTVSITGLFGETVDNETLTKQNMSDFLDDLPETQRKLFIDEDRQTTIITLNIARLENDSAKTFINDLNQYLADNELQGIESTVTGQAVIDAEMLSALTSGRMEMSLLGIGLVFLGLLLIYRSFLKAIVPVFPISLIIGWSGGAMYLLGLDYTPLTATMGALIIGIGTEFTILLMERYFEEKAKGASKEEAMVTTVSKIGQPILASGLTTIGGFSALLFSDFLILREFGIVTLLNITFCLISALVVLPPLIIMLDRKKTKSVSAVNPA